MYLVTKFLSGPNYIEQHLATASKFVTLIINSPWILKDFVALKKEDIYLYIFLAIRLEAFSVKLLLIWMPKLPSSHPTSIKPHFHLNKNRSFLLCAILTYSQLSRSQPHLSSLCLSICSQVTPLKTTLKRIHQTSCWWQIKAIINCIYSAIIYKWSEVGCYRCDHTGSKLSVNFNEWIGRT